jgi:hypothetical protein
MIKQVETAISVYSEPIDIGLNVCIEYYPHFPSESLIRLGLGCLSVKVTSVEFSGDRHRCDVSVAYDSSKEDYFRNVMKLKRFFNRRFRVQADLFQQYYPHW